MKMIFFSSIPLTQCGDPRRFVIGPGIWSSGISENDRVFESYDLGMIAEMISEDAAGKISNQTKLDEENESFTPQLQLKESELTPLGLVTLGEVFYRGYESVIYTVQEFPEVLIKYQANCDEARNALEANEPVIHPLLNDYWYSKEAFSHKVSGENMFVSPPAFICESKSGKCDFEMLPNEFQICYERWGTVRYMIMKRMSGTNLSDMQMEIGRFPFVDVMNLGIAMIRLLEILHTKARVVHGDIFGPNIMLMPSSQGGYSMRFVDFGRAFRLTRKSNNRRYLIQRFKHYLFSFWQMEGFEWGPRDDIMKAVQLIAQLMHSREYSSYQNALTTTSGDGIKKFKMEENIFVIPENSFGIPACDPIDELVIPEESRLAIRGHLATILRLARRLTDINEVPQYKRIIAALIASRDLALVPSEHSNA